MARGFSLDNRAGSFGWFSGSRISVMELRVLIAVDLPAECCVLGVCCFLGWRLKNPLCMLIA